MLECQLFAALLIMIFLRNYFDDATKILFRSVSITKFQILQQTHSFYTINQHVYVKYVQENRYLSKWIGLKKLKSSSHRIFT